MHRKGKEKGGEEDREYDGKTAVRLTRRSGRRAMADERSWRMLIENMEKDKEKDADNQDHSNGRYARKSTLVISVRLCALMCLCLVIL